ncbi:ABC transporter permease [Xylanimonas oleitrophica]|uniref:Transport permease protein n=1 Tax=Xylanimonas oleitrophica TaxID=2607479 RepID=A0A2W5X221_9MICO|nr:ABC transporter permease [Xylanimonas oleitrophica]PZR54846.1 ABC transporter permease [Xylanimonas oleitrophica]
MSTPRPTTATQPAAERPPAPPARTEPRLPGVLPLALVRARVELLGFLRERDAVFFILLYPVLMLLIFSTVFGSDGLGLVDDAGREVSFARYFLPGMVATGVMLSSFQSLAISVAVERDDGTLRRLRATPLPPVAYFLGKAGQILVVTLGQVAALLAVAALVYDVPLPDEPGRWWTFAWVLLLGSATGTVCGVAFSSLPRSGRSATAVVTPVVLVLQFISGVFFMLDQLPVWLQRVAEVFPLKWMAQGMRSVFLPDSALVLEPSGSWQHGPAAAILGAWLLVGLVVGVRTFRWRRRDDG